MSITELTVPTDYQTYYEQVGPQNLGGSNLDERMRIVAQSEAEKIYWESLNPRRPVGSPLSSLALIGFDADGARWASPINGPGKPRKVAWGIVSAMLWDDGGSMQQVMGIMPGGLGTMYGQDAAAIIAIGQEIMERDRTRITATAEHYARLGAAQELKWKTERAKETQDSIHRSRIAHETCPVCGKYDHTTVARFVHSGVNARGISSPEPTILSCMDCWGRANEAWRAALKKGRR